MTALASQVYQRLPVLLQDASISLYGWRWKRRRFGGVFDEELRGFKDREGFTAEQWNDHQTVELRRLLHHAFDTVPYYRRTYSKLGFKSRDFQKFELEDLKRLPMLEKAELRAFGRSDLLSTNR
jgi:phenylacetate-CoA ligase